ncbi:WD40 repeat domain-containing protein [Lignipirellula cremea]|uniref:WD domain, G-beta repeat n=1 Tax=Lignipirellula cremea TaxID=2528010 RepID=A0A518DVT5_9BACT|nr:hypothetical protein [Lignipirellula cremea]QDU95933.1 WD domain, G-beta repeat [Lignipirellula cremea]
MFAATELAPPDVSQTWESQKLEHDRPLLAAAFSPCGLYALAGAQDEGVHRWHLESGEKTTLAAHQSWVHSLAFSPDKQHAFTSDLHGVVHCWKYADKSPRPVWSIVDAHDGWVVATAVSRDGKQLITAGNDGRVRLWSTANGKHLSDLLGHGTEVYSLALHPDGKTLVSGDLLGNVLVWNLADGKLLRKLDAKVLTTREEDFLADVGGVRSLAFNADGTRLAVGGMTDATTNAFCAGKPAILVFDWSSGKLKNTLRLQKKSDGPVKGVVYLEGDILAGVAENLNSSSAMEFWKPNEEASFHAVVRDSGYSLHLHPDQRHLLVAGITNNGRGGNGGVELKDYVSHNGSLIVYALHAKAEAAKS